MKKRYILPCIMIVAALWLFVSIPAFADDQDDNDNASSASDAGDKDGGDADKNDTDNDDTPAAAAVAPGAASAPAQGNWWHPHPGTKWHIQYAGKIDPNLKVAVYDVDLVEADESLIKQLHGRGVKVICYFSAGSYEGWRPDAKQFPPAALGKNNGWKDEKWLDIRQIDKLKPIMAGRIKMAAQKGCDAVDPDNVEGYDNTTGFPLTPAEQIAYNKMIAQLAHDAGLAVGLKNDVDQAGPLLNYFDFQVNEQCFEYGTCNEIVPFIKAGKAVFNVEYNVPTTQFCPKANAMNFNSLKKKLELDAWAQACR